MGTGRPGDLNTYSSSILALKPQPPSPDITQIGVFSDSPLEPLSGLLDLALGPEKSGNSTDNQRIIIGFLECVR